MKSKVLLCTDLVTPPGQPNEHDSLHLILLGIKKKKKNCHYVAFYLEFRNLCFLRSEILGKEKYIFILRKSGMVGRFVIVSESPNQTAARLWQMHWTWIVSTMQVRQMAWRTFTKTSRVSDQNGVSPLSYHCRDILFWLETLEIHLCYLYGFKKKNPQKMRTTHKNIFPPLQPFKLWQIKAEWVTFSI